MFLVHDTIADRHKYISRFLDGEEAAVGILLAAADFERGVRRGILGLGTAPTKEIKSTYFGPGFHGLDRFKDAWKAEVKPRTRRNLANDVVRRWDSFRDAYKLRNVLIHGATGRITPSYASNAARTILGASLAIHELAREHGVDLDRTIRRYKRYGT
jgi:hypothetical protein